MPQPARHLFPASGGGSGPVSGLTFCAYTLPGARQATGNSWHHIIFVSWHEKNMTETQLHAVSSSNRLWKADYAVCISEAGRLRVNI